MYDEWIGLGRTNEPVVFEARCRLCVVGQVGLIGKFAGVYKLRSRQPVVGTGDEHKFILEERRPRWQRLDC